MEDGTGQKEMHVNAFRAGRYFTPLGMSLTSSQQKKKKKLRIRNNMKKKATKKKSSKFIF